jgi:hypothetical protein
MRGLVLSLSQPSSIFLVSLIVLSTNLLWAQGKSSLTASATQLFDAPSQLATVAVTQAHSLFTDRGLPLSVRQTQGETESGMKFFALHNTGAHRLPTNTEAALERSIKTAELRGQNQKKYSFGSATSKWLTFASIYGKVHHETVYSTDEPEYYAQHIPWAGSFILRLCRQAKLHPRVTGVLKVFRPQF